MFILIFLNIISITAFEVDFDKQNVKLCYDENTTVFVNYGLCNYNVNVYDYRNSINIGSNNNFDGDFNNDMLGHGHFYGSISTNNNGYISNQEPALRSKADNTSPLG
jgi:hypothetical protein